MKKSNIFSFITGFLIGTVCCLIIVLGWREIEQKSYQEKIDNLESLSEHDQMMIDAYQRRFDEL